VQVGEMLKCHRPTLGVRHDVAEQASHADKARLDRQPPPSTPSAPVTQQQQQRQQETEPPTDPNEPKG